MKSSPSIWHLLHNVKSTVKISSNFVAFLENINFMWKNVTFQLCSQAYSKQSEYLKDPNGDQTHKSLRSKVYKGSRYNKE